MSAQQPSDNPRLLVVDDDQATRKLLQRYFESRFYQIQTVPDAFAASDVLKSDEFDVILLDLALPGMSGMDFCRTLRTQSNTPVIVLSGMSQEAEKVLALELGADDYVTKPFSLRELEARVRATHRRSMGTETASVDRKVYHFEDFALDVDRHELSRAGEAIALTTGEFRLLQAFVEHANRVLSRDQLLNWTRGIDAQPFDRSIDVLVGRLRSKLGDNGPDFRLIKTQRGHGYLFAGDVRRGD